MKAPLLALLLAAAVLAGCAQAPGTAGGDGAGPGGPSPVRMSVPFDQMPEGAGHDHADPAAHQMLWNYAFTARDPLQSNALNVAGLHAIDLAGGYLFGAVYGSHAVSIDGGMQVWDVHTDPAKPASVGRLILPGSVGGDRSIGVTPDAEYVVLGAEPVDCYGHINPAGAAFSLYLIDVRDKANPAIVDVVTPTGGSLGDPTQTTPRYSTHSVFVQRIAGTDYAFAAGEVYRIDRVDGAARLSFVGLVPTQHDTYVRPTPWNTTWALSANGGAALMIYDVTDPAQAHAVATWDVPEREALKAKQGDYYLHTVDVAFLDGQTIIIVASEDFETGSSGSHTSPFWVLDGNPIAAVKPGGTPVKLEQLGAWSNPWNRTHDTMRFSLHNQRVHDGGLLTVASYHAGFFQFDMRHPDAWADPVLIASGVYAEGSPPETLDPVESTVQSAVCGLASTVDTPSYMDVAIGLDGTLYFADPFMGLYTLAPTPGHPVYGDRTTAPGGADAAA